MMKTFLPNLDINKLPINEWQVELTKKIYGGSIGLFILYLFIVGTGKPEVIQPLSLTAIIFLGSCASSIWLLKRSFFFSQVFWQTGMVISIVAATRLFDIYEIAYLLIFIPLISIINGGWFWAFSALVLISISIMGINSFDFDAAKPSFFEIIIITGSFCVTLLSFSVYHTFASLTQWVIENYQETSEHMEDARQQRAELLQIQEDMLKANSELARLSDRLRSMTQVAEDARKVKEEFVANVSHELRTPLNMIIGFSELISQSPQVYGSKLPQKLLADIASVQRNSEQLARLVNDVLDLSQIESGRMALSKSQVNLNDLVEEAISSVKVLYDSKALFLRFTPSPYPLVVFCDGTRIREVLLNLLSNAGRFTETGGVTITTMEDEGNAILHVRDTGPGISQPDMEKLFEPFSQLDTSTRRKHGGSGLGLAISKRIIEMHDGRMWLASEVGQGTTFSFSLRLHSPEPEVFIPAGRRWLTPFHQRDVIVRRSKAPQVNLNSRFVLVEKDDKLSHLFERYADQKEIVITHSLDAAWEEINRLPSQAVIINTASPSSILEDSRWQHGIPYDTPVITCWAPGEGDAALRLGAIRYMKQPIRLENLLSIVQDLGETIQDILLVDDSIEVLQLLARQLSSSDRKYHTIRARNGIEALKLIKNRHPDLILLDLMMPDMDGYQVLQKLKADPSTANIPVIIISSLDPNTGPVIHNNITITSKNGFSVDEFIDLIDAVTEITHVSQRTNGQTKPEIDHALQAS